MPQPKMRVEIPLHELCRGGNEFLMGNADLPVMLSDVVLFVYEEGPDGGPVIVIENRRSKDKRNGGFSNRRKDDKEEYVVDDDRG